MERTGIQVENEKSRPILTAKNICVLVYVLTPNNETGGSGEEPPVSSILESNSAKLRAKNSVLQSKMNNLCQISRQIFRRSFSRNSARYKTFMFLCQVPRLCQIDRLPCRTEHGIPVAGQRHFHHGCRYAAYGGIQRDGGLLRNGRIAAVQCMRHRFYDAAKRIPSD